MTETGNHCGEPRRAPVAVVVVGAGHQLAPAQLDAVRPGVGAAQVADVVQQRRRDERGRRAGRLGPGAGLQQVRRDGDRLAQVVGRSLGGEQFRDRIDR